jgi:hypothetical protein
MTEFIPGAGPPPHRIPSFTSLSFQPREGQDKRPGPARATRPGSHSSPPRCATARTRRQDRNGPHTAGCGRLDYQFNNAGIAIGGGCRGYGLDVPIRRTRCRRQMLQPQSIAIAHNVPPTNCFEGTTARVLCRPAKTQLASERERYTQSFAQRSSAVDRSGDRSGLRTLRRQARGSWVSRRYARGGGSRR